MGEEQNTDIKSFLSGLPNKPGVYKFLNKEAVIIYIGKAKNLKKRVSSYFNKKHDNNKTSVMVRKINSIEHIVVDDENDALLLENSLIKQWQPRYNVMLKDDKTYPWICITNEEFPRIFLTRNKLPDGSEYFGPYSSVYTVKTVLQMIRQLYKLRTCRLKLNEVAIVSGKFEVCLEAHIGNCKAPCVGRQSSSDYCHDVDEARQILKGKMLHIIEFLKKKMLKLASELKFEEANHIKEKIAIIENFKAKSTVVNSVIKNVDVYGFAEDMNSVYFSYLKIMDGAVIHAHNTEIRRKLNESPDELLLALAFEMWQQAGNDAGEAIVPFIPEFELKGIKWTVPQRGDKFKLLELATRNAKLFMMEKHRVLEKKDPENAIERKLKTLQHDLHITEMPDYFECFDNSNLQGTNPVASCVVFRNARPVKKEYRHFNIKTVVGADDFASMEELVYRRYQRRINENLDLPKLIIVDGGKGQLSAAVNSLQKLGLYGKIAIIGIAKRLEEIYFPGDSVPIYLDKNSESLKLIRHARDEAHRFAIEFHRRKRSAAFLYSELEQIDGIGEKTIALLLSKYRSVEAIKKLTYDELILIAGQSKALLLFDYFNKQ